MRLAVLSLGAACALAFAAPALAGGDTLKVDPFTFDPGNTGSIVSAWQPGTGLADAGKSDHGLVLQKNAPTSTNAAAGAVVSGAEGQQLTEIGFDVKGYCNAGSPRFNVVDQDGNTHFFGCVYGSQTPGADGWTRVRQTGADAFPPMDASDTIARVLIIADEQGQSVVDNVDVNGTLVGKPGNAR